MGIERYLCVGGIEVANPCRTLAYLRHLGTPCLVRPPSKADCGCCPEWDPAAPPGICSITVAAGFELRCAEVGSPPPLIPPSTLDVGVQIYAEVLTDAMAAFGLPGPVFYFSLEGVIPPGGDPQAAPAGLSLSWQLADPIPGSEPPAPGDVPSSGWAALPAPSIFGAVIDYADPSPLPLADPLWMLLAWTGENGCSYRVPIYFPAGLPEDPLAEFRFWVGYGYEGDDWAYMVMPEGGDQGQQNGGQVLPEEGSCPCQDAVCLGIQSVSGGEGPYLAMLRVFQAEDCSDLAGPVPSTNDPGWITFGQIPAEFFNNCSPIAEIVGEAASCGWYWITVSDAAGGSCDFYLRLDGESMGEGDLGLCGVSFDDGATWAVSAEHTCSGPCSIGGDYSLTWSQEPGEFEYCSGIVSFSGGEGTPITLSAHAYLTADGPTTADWPGLAAPGWLSAGVGTMAQPLGGIGGCDSYPISDPDGFYRFDFYEAATGATVRLILLQRFSLMGPGDSGGSMYSLDDGATWALIPNGTSIWEWAFDEGTGEFTTPAEDDAPWYDAAVPESADVLGVFIEEAKLSVPWDRSARQKLKGSSLGPGRLKGRELTISGWLYARSEAASAYGRQWLFEALAGDGCGDDCDLPDAEIYTHCARQEGDSSGRRTLKRVGLTAFDPEIEPEFPRACGFKFEAVLEAEIPELFLERTLAVRLDGFQDLPIECNICSPCPAPTTGCSCGALAQPPRVVPQPEAASGYCEPIEIQRATQSIDAPAFWREATTIITVEPGEEPLANMRIRGWSNPAGLAAPTPESDLFACQEPCIDLEVACLPARSKLIVDGTTRRVTLLCEGVEDDGYPYLTSGGGRRIHWPDVGCAGLMLVADADVHATGEAASVLVEVFPRERG